ncbi:hypothetical protein [Nafulsella turpanensis]|uniref:hypothetical protein n=1 Tax=Nafulsella turpanensis TaxID=1265690 RepID=UPI000345563E|nr:hypothetical protein [Nafulsella turpanensis]
MDILQRQEKRLYQQLFPLFEQQGYEAVPSKKQFRQPCKNGFRAVLFSISEDAEEKIIDVQLGIRINLVEELVLQFLGGKKELEKDSTTIITSLARLKHQSQRRLIITEDEQSLQQSCTQITAAMQEKGFKFLKNFSQLHRIDKVVNRKPSRQCPIMHNQIQRCFRGITIARMLHRNDFDKLVSIYGSYLYSQWASRQILDNYNKLVNFLKNFSFN